MSGPVSATTCPSGICKLALQLFGIELNQRHTEPAHGQQELNPPFIVPPTWDKGSSNKTIGKVWAVAHEELVEAHRWIIIGYSAPCDAHSRVERQNARPQRTQRTLPVPETPPSVVTP